MKQFTYKQNVQQKSQAILELSGGGGGIICHGIEYLIRHVLYFSSKTAFYNRQTDRQTDRIFIFKIP